MLRRPPTPKHRTRWRVLLASTLLVLELGVPNIASGSLPRWREASADLQLVRPRTRVKAFLPFWESVIEGRAALGLRTHQRFRVVYDGTTSDPTFHWDPFGLEGDGYTPSDGIARKTAKNWSKDRESTLKLLAESTTPESSDVAIVGKALLTLSIELGGGVVDLLNLGEGVEEGTAAGYVRDGIRVLSIYLMGRGGRPGAKSPPKLRSPESPPSVPESAPVQPLAPKPPPEPASAVPAALGGGCFVAGTTVLTSDGVRPIETVAVGDWVWAWDELTKEPGWYRATRTYVKPERAVLRVVLQGADGTTEEIGVTAEHPFGVGGQGWVEAQHLRPGDEIETATGSSVQVVSIQLAPTLETVYNFEVEAAHTYFVGGLGAWVHNQSSVSGAVPKGGTTRVGRWMSEAEYKAMQSTGRVQESLSGTTHVAHPAAPEAFMSQAKPGSFYVEFDVPSSAVRPTQQGWGKIIGPQSLEGRLAAKKGLPVPEMPDAMGIEHTATKFR